MVRFDNTYIGKTIVFLQKYKDHNGLIYNKGDKGTIVNVTSSYEVLVAIKGIKTPMRLYNHWIDNIHVKIEG